MCFSRLLIPAVFLLTILKDKVSQHLRTSFLSSVDRRLSSASYGLVIAYLSLINAIAYVLLVASPDFSGDPLLWHLSSCYRGVFVDCKKQRLEEPVSGNGSMTMSWQVA